VKEWYMIMRYKKECGGSERVTRIYIQVIRCDEPEKMTRGARAGQERAPRCDKESGRKCEVGWSGDQEVEPRGEAEATTSEEIRFSVADEGGSKSTAWLSRRRNAMASGLHSEMRT
jgi:hypothetical protein